MENAVDSDAVADRSLVPDPLKRSTGESSLVHLV